MKLGEWQIQLESTTLAESNSIWEYLGKASVGKRFHMDSELQLFCKITVLKYRTLKNSENSS